MVYDIFMLYRQGHNRHVFKHIPQAFSIALTTFNWPNCDWQKCQSGLILGFVLVPATQRRIWPVSSKQFSWSKNAMLWVMKQKNNESCWWMLWISDGPWILLAQSTRMKAGRDYEHKSRNAVIYRGSLWWPLKGSSRWSLKGSSQWTLKGSSQLTLRGSSQSSKGSSWWSSEVLWLKGPWGQRDPLCVSVYWSF